MGYQSSLSESPYLKCFSKARCDKTIEVPLDPYIAWLTKHPSALDSFEGMMGSAEVKNVVVFLDYDGTLSPIVDDPDQAFMSEKMRSAVEEVAHVLPTAIVSGRCREKVKQFVQLQNVTYAGSHGMDILTTKGYLKCSQQHQSTAVDEKSLIETRDSCVQIKKNKGNEVIYFQPAKDFLPIIQEILKVLEENIKTIKGATVEDNKFCVSVHYRRVDLEDVNYLKEMVQSIMEDFPDFQIKGGKKVMEIRPRIDWDKGGALLYLIQNLGFTNSNDFLPLYIGDDETDEDAFKAIQDIGRGYPIVVSSIPKETKASYSLRDTNEVMSFLMLLTKWKKAYSSASQCSEDKIED